MLDDAACANALNNSYEYVKKNQDEDYLDILNKTLDTYSQMADRSMENIVILTSAGTLDIERKDPYKQTLEVATKYMTYWSICITTLGIPQTLPMGGQIVSVSNDALSYISSLKSDLDNLARTASPGDNYNKFTKLLFDYAKKIQWTVNEVYPDPSSGTPVPMVYTVTIS